MSAEQPRLSVVIPTHNRGAALLRVLAAYEQQVPETQPFEVIVVDDGSTDDTLERLRGSSSARYCLVVASQENRGPAGARNHALRLVRGELVLFTGDDIVPAPDLLRQHVLAHERAGGGHEVAILGTIAWPADLARTTTMRHVDGVGAQQFSYLYLVDGEEYDFRHFYTSNLSVKRALLDQEPSHFSTDFPYAAFEDAELAYRLWRHGLRIVYRSAPRAWHYHSYTAPRFFERQRRCGAMAVVLYRRHPELRRYLEIEPVEWARLRWLLGSPAARRRTAETERRLAELEARALRIAAFFDGLDRPPMDPLLRALFRYGFLKGVAETLWREPSPTVCAALFLSEVPAAVERFCTAMAALTVPVPTADSEALRRLLRPS